MSEYRALWNDVSGGYRGQVSCNKGSTRTIVWNAPSASWYTGKVIDEVTWDYSSKTGYIDRSWGPTYYEGSNQYRMEFFSPGLGGGTMYGVTLVIKYHDANGASTWTLSTAVISFGGNVQINGITSKNSSNKHTLKIWTTSDTSKTTAPYYYSKSDINSGSTFQIPVDACAVAPNSTSIRGIARLVTIDSTGKEVGSTDKAITLNVPASVVPTISSFQVQAFNEAFHDEKPITGKSTAQLKCVAEGKYGSTITGYNFGLGNQTQPVFTTGVLSLNNTYTVTVTDSRGRTTSSQCEFPAYRYSPPGLLSFDVYRADEDMEQNGVEGAYVAIKANWTYTQLIDNVANNLTVGVQYKTTEREWRELAGDTQNNVTRVFKPYNFDFPLTSTCEVKITLTDDAGTSLAEVRTVPTAYLFMQWDANRNIFAFGAHPISDISEAIVVSDMWKLWTKGRDLASNTHHRVHDKTNAVASWYNTGIQNQTVDSSVLGWPTKPSEHGSLLSVATEDISQLWFSQPRGSIYHRQGNIKGFDGEETKANIEADCWVKILDETDITNQNINNTNTIPSSAVVHSVNQKVEALECSSALEVVTNNNGTAMKFSNGYMICFKVVNTEQDKTAWGAWGALNVSDGIDLGKWPVEFSEIPTVQITGTSTNGYNFYLATKESSSLSNTECGAIQLVRGSEPPNAGVKARISVVGFGKWKK